MTSVAHAGKRGRASAGRAVCGRLQAVLVAGTVACVPVGVVAQSANPSGVTAPRAEGERISLNFHHIELRHMLQVIADYSGRKLVAGPRLDRMRALQATGPWREVLNRVACEHGLVVTVTEREIREIRAV